MVHKDQRESVDLLKLIYHAFIYLPLILLFFVCIEENLKAGGSV